MVPPFETDFPKVDRTPYLHWHELKILLILKSKILLGDPSPCTNLALPNFSQISYKAISKFVFFFTF